MPTNVAQLISYIFQIIRTNGVGAITATTLSSVLFAMVTVLSTGLTGANCQVSSQAGMIADGVTDNSHLLTTWFTKLNGQPGCLQFVSGTYKFNSQVSLTLSALQSITFGGQGPATVLFSSGAHDLFNITYSGGYLPGPNPLAGVVNISSFRFVTDQPLTQTAIYIDGQSRPGMQTPETVLADNTFEGTTTTTGWGTSMWFNNLTNVEVDDPLINSPCLASNCTDTAIKYIGVDGHHPTSLQIHHGTMVRGGYFLYASGDFEGVTVGGHTQLTAQNYPIYIYGDQFAGSGEAAVTDSFLNGNINTVSILGMANVTFSGNNVYQGARPWMPANAPMVIFNNNGRNSDLNLSATGNTLQGFVSTGQGASGTPPQGFQIIASGNGTFTSNVLTNLGTAWTLDPTSSRWTGAGNILAGTTTAPIDNGVFNTIQYATNNTVWQAGATNQTYDIDHGAPASGATVANVSRITGSVGGLPLWQMNLGDQLLETGGLIGQNFSLGRFSNNGVFQSFDLLDRKENGNLELANSLFVGASSAGTNTGGTFGAASGKNIIAIAFTNGCPAAIANNYVFCAEADGLKIVSPSGTKTTIAPP